MSPTEQMPWDSSIPLSPLSALSTQGEVLGPPLRHLKLLLLTQQGQQHPQCCIRQGRWGPVPSLPGRLEDQGQLRLLFLQCL